jgi:hypothetical protein
MIVTAHIKFSLHTTFLDGAFQAEDERLPGESIEDGVLRVRKHLENAVEILKMATHPHLYQESKPESEPLSYFGVIAKDGTGFIPVISNDKEPEDKRIAALIADIYSCTEIKVLESYRIMAKSKPELQAAYDQHLESLQNRPA